MIRMAEGEVGIEIEDYLCGLTAEERRVQETLRLGWKTVIERWDTEDGVASCTSQYGVDYLTFIGESYEAGGVAVDLAVAQMVEAVVAAASPGDQKIVVRTPPTINCGKDFETSRNVVRCRVRLHFQAADTKVDVVADPDAGEFDPVKLVPKARDEFDPAAVRAEIVAKLPDDFDGVAVLWFKHLSNGNVRSSASYRVRHAIDGYAVPHMAFQRLTDTLNEG